MLTAHTYEGICQSLADRFRYRNPEQTATVRMIGLLFTRPTSDVARSDIVPNLDYFHCRSGDHIDFFCAGYALGPEEDHEHHTVRGSRGDFWKFNNAAFDHLRREIESRTKWHYSGGTDLILCNGRHDPNGARSWIDFGTSIVCVLDTMKQHRAISTVEMFFETIFRFAEESRCDDPTWGFSNQQGMRIGGSALRRIVLSLLPKKLGDDVQRAAHFAVQDVSRAPEAE